MENVVWNLRDYQKAKVFLKVATEEGYSWNDGNDYADDPRWWEFKSETCYNFWNGEHGSLEMYEAMGFDVITVE